MFADIIRPITLGFSLLRRFWPQLIALVLAGVLVSWRAGHHRRLTASTAPTAEETTT